MHAHAWCVLICVLELLPARAACVLAGNTCFELTRLETEPCWTAAQRKHKGNCCFVVSEAQSGGSSERLFVCRTCPFWWWVCVCCMFKGVFWKGKRLQGKSESEFWLAPRSWAFCVSTEHGSVCVCGCRRSYFTSLIDQSTTESESLRTNLPSKKLPNVAALNFLSVSLVKWVQLSHFSFFLPPFFTPSDGDSCLFTLYWKAAVPSCNTHSFSDSFSSLCWSLNLIKIRIQVGLLEVVTPRYSTSCLFWENV